MDEYFSIVNEIISDIKKTQQDSLEKAALICMGAIEQNKNLFFFGTGHSHMLAEEPFYRAGGLIPVKAILETGLMLHDGEEKSTSLERLEGYAQILLEFYQVSKGDVLFVISNSGINAVPVEMALGAKQIGASVIAITSVKHSKHAKSRHKSNKKLYELANIVLDNCGYVGDAAVSLEQSNMKTGPTSTIAGALLINALIVQISKKFERKGATPPLYVSANIEGGKEHNAKFRKKFSI